MLTPLLGKGASVIFALALLLAGLSSSITAGMAGGTIFSGIFNKPYDISTKRNQTGCTDNNGSRRSADSSGPFTF